MPIHTKKAAVRNREVSINNQIANIFVNNNGTVSINQDSIPKYESKTATTSLAISGTYLIPLVSATSGVQGLNKSANLLYDTNTNTLQAQNLTTTYLPQCSQVPTQTNQLVNKAYLDQYLGSYNQLWIYDDWMTGDVSGSLNWYTGLSNGASISMLTSEIGHPGIVRLSKYMASQVVELYLSSNMSFTSKTFKCARFLVRPFAGLTDNISTTRVFLYLGPTRVSSSIDFTNCAYWHFNSYDNLFSTNDPINWSCCVNMQQSPDISPNSSYNAGTLANKWILFEIELNDKKPSFYITVIGETSRILVHKELTQTIDSSVFLQPRIFIGRNTNLGTGTNAYLDVDYVDITYNKI
jgi:hypothetical protein